MSRPIYSLLFEQVLGLDNANEDYLLIISASDRFDFSEFPAYISLRHWYGAQ